MSRATTIPSWVRELDPVKFERIEAWTKAGRYNLGPGEEWWRNHQPFFQSHGYMLRPRYRPGWKPSWLEDKLKPEYCEDAFSTFVCSTFQQPTLIIAAFQHVKVIDAVRMRDGSPVAIKRVNVRSLELKILHFLANPSKSDDPMNHCAPVIEEIPADDNSGFVFIIMPLLRGFDNPPFCAVGEVIECMTQTLEVGWVLCVMINVHVCPYRDCIFYTAMALRIGTCIVQSGRAYLTQVYRDCARGNIMMDASLLFPRGFHPARGHREPDGIR